MTGLISPDIFIQGAIPVDFITTVMLRHSRDTHIGAYNIFLGQIRGDEARGSRVKAIEYTAHAELAREQFRKIQASLMENYALTSMDVYHSLGTVNTGDICFFVLVTSGHRQEAFKACNEAVDRIKAEMPIWGKLILEDDSVQWKENIS